MSEKEKVLFLDLDGTLLRTDSLWELVCLAIAGGQGLSLFWVIFGRAALKRRLARCCSLDLSLLPWNVEVLNLAREAHARGFHIWLSTGADEILARKVVAHFGFFAGVLASDGQTNLKGEAKAKALRRRFGFRGFAYAGDARCDLAVWREASTAYVVEGSSALTAAAAKVCPYVQPLLSKDKVSLWNGLLTSFKPQHWVKNTLLFVVPFLAHNFTLLTFARCGLGFIIFCLISSAGYIVNDLMDLNADRAHPEKRNRPFAAGDLPLQYGLFFSFSMFITAFLASLSLGLPFFYCVVSYVLITISYSYYFKCKLLIDVIILSILFVLRIVAGITAINANYSPWLLCFSFFIFLALSITKRIIELRRLELSGAEGAMRRAYLTRDIVVLLSLAGGSICCATLTLALYVGELRAMELYQSPEWLLLICPPLFLWLARLLLLAERGVISYDPIHFLLHDRQSRLILAGGGVLYLLATFGWL